MSRSTFLMLMIGVVLVLAVGAVLWSRTEARSAAETEDTPVSQGLLARFWELEVDPAQIDEFTAIGVENTEASVRLEPGVLMMHSFQLAEDPKQVRVLEVYASREAYESHIKTSHFLKYKNAAERMVRSQKLISVDPLLLCAKGGIIPVLEAQEAMVRTAVLEIGPAQLDAYKALLTEEQEASVRLEPGVLMLHSVQFADDPTQVRLLEVYANRQAYESHLKTPHFLKYKVGTEKMVRSLELVPNSPVLLGAKRKSQGAETCF